MMRLMSKRGSMIAMLMSISGVALASETRFSVMQSQAGLEDDTQVFRFPGQVKSYKLASIELGTYTATKVSAGAIADLSGTNFGVYVSRDNWLFTQTQIGTDYSLYDVAIKSLNSSGTNGAAAYLNAPERPVEFLMGMGLGGGNNIGFRLAYASVKKNIHTEAVGSGKVSETNRSGSQLEIGAGYHTSGSNSLDLALTFIPTAEQKRSVKADTAESSLSMKGGTTTHVDARWVAEENKSGLFADATLMMRSSKASVSASGVSKEGSYTDQVWDVEGGYVAMGGNNSKLAVSAQIMKVTSTGPQVKVSADNSTATFTFQSNDEKAKIDSMVVNGKFAGEANVYGGFGMMAGMTYVLYGTQTYTDNTDGTNSKTEKTIAETSDSSLWSLGAFYKADALRVDASYSRDFLYNGPNFITGNTTSPWLGKISATYNL